MAKLRVPIKVRSNKQLVAKSAEDLRNKVPKVAKSRLKDAATELRDRMKKPGKKVKYPINWESIKQQLKVIIMLRKRGNLPYKRRRKMERGWKVVAIQNGHAVENSVKGAKYVYGDLKGQKQSSIHKGRWPDFEKQTQIVVKNLPKGMQKAMAEVASSIVQEKAPYK